METPESKKVNALITAETPFACPNCIEPFQTEEAFREHKAMHKGGEFELRMVPVERLFFFEDRAGRLKVYNEKHALSFGLESRNSMIYLGMIETNDPGILDKSLDEIKSMNLPKVRPRDMRKTIEQHGQQVPYSSLNDIK